MKAFLVEKYKKGGALRLGERPEPALGDEDILVAIHAAGLIRSAFPRMFPAQS